jgi:SAM-dependent methyltransferase
VEPQPYNYHNNKIKAIPSTIENLKLIKQVDIALAFEVIEHITDPRIFLQKICDSLVKGGLFIFSTPNSNGYEVQLLKNNSDTVCYDHVSLYNPQSIEILLNANGFELVHVETPGRLDTEILKRAFLRGHLSEKSDVALAYLLLEEKDHYGDFQKYLVSNQLSSHMRVVAKKI